MIVSSHTPSKNREVLERFIEMTTTGDLDSLEEVLDPEYVQMIPQCGELVSGVDNVRNLGRCARENGSAGAYRLERAIESRPTDLMIGGLGMALPTFNLVRINEEGETITAYGKTTYPDGSMSHVVTIVTFRNHRILQQVDFFAPPFHPPSWRSQWTRPIQESAG